MACPFPTTISEGVLPVAVVAVVVVLVLVQPPVVPACDLLPTLNCNGDDVETLGTGCGDVAWIPVERVDEV